MIARDKRLQLIESRPGVCGGAACIVGMRIPVWMLYQARLSGMSDEAILDMHRRLTPTQLAAAWDYARLHEKKLREHIRDNNED